LNTKKESGRKTINVEELAKILGIGRNLCYEAVRRGDIPGVIRLGNRIVISRQAIESMLTDHAQSDGG